MELKKGVISPHPSYLMALPRDPALIRDPAGVSARLTAALKEEGEIQLRALRPQKGFLHLSLTFRGAEYEIRIFPERFALEGVYTVCHRLSPADLAAAEAATGGLMVETRFPAAPLDGLHLQLKVAMALFPDLVAVADLSAQKVYSPKWAALAAGARTPPGPDYLFGLQAVAGADGPAWIHTHGLNRCALVELEVPGCPRDKLSVYGQILESAARVAVDRRTLPDERAPMLLARLAGNASLVVCWVDWETGLEGMPQEWPGSRADRAEEHNRDTGLLFLYPDPQSLEADRPVPLIQLNPASFQNPAYLLTNTETQRMAELARERLGWLRRGLQTPGAQALVKLGLPVDPDQIQEASDGREHVWCQLKELTQTGFVAVLTQAPYFISTLDAGSEVEAGLDQLTDWLLVLGESGIRPDEAYLLEMED